jgi:uncharacterized protein (AIM24 family)
MPFCINCGTRVEADSRLCMGCGKPSGNGTKPVPAVVREPLDYTIQGENLQVVRIRLKPGQEVFAEAGKMVYKFAEIQWESRGNGESLGDKEGGSLFLTRFRATSPSEVGFAGAHPGRIQAFELKAGQSMLVERDGFLCAQSTARLDIASVKKLGAGIFGCERFILERLSGPGTVFIHAGGDFVEFILNPGQVIQVDAGRVVAFEDTVSYEVQPAAGIKTAPSGDEGLFLVTLTGPGRVVSQSMTRREASPFHGGSDEHDAVPALSGVSGSED